jgi:protein-disulfide isomerase
MSKSKIDIIPPKDIWVGDLQAPVSLVMFGDYESEACARAHEVIKQIMARYEGKVRFNFRHFPLTQIHQKAHKAAEASVCVAQFGKFWEMHDLLFKNRRNLGSISLRDYAIEAGVKDKNFLPKLTDSVYGWTVRNDLMEGLNRGVREVPAIFLNGELYVGNITVPGLSTAIDNLLKAGKNKAA